ncbi:MAG: fibronectin type III domain-containing protein [Saprospiraceae bacterium]|nr:fibronectin type III domain-containing protein [Saprospiraceae bacterium]
MKTVVLSAFTKLGQDSLAVYAKNAITLMTEDPQFAPLSKEVGEAKKASDAFEIALANNINGGRTATIEKDKCKSNMLQQLKNLATLVDLMANGDEAIVMAAGFDVRKSANSYTSLDAPNVLKLVNETKAGLVTFNLSKVLGANIYGIERRIKIENEDSPWVNGDYTSSRKRSIEDLESGKTYQFRFRAIGSKGLVSPWSAIVETLVS